MSFFSQFNYSGDDAPTSWTLLRDTVNTRLIIALPARDRFYRRYAPAVYAWARSRCSSIEDAEDLTHSFFEHLIATEWFSSVDQSKGRMRPFMMVTLANHTKDVWRRSSAQKRRGSQTDLRFDLQEVFTEVEQYTAAGGSLAAEPDQAFQQEWARGMLNETMDTLEDHYEQKGKGQLFRVLSPWIASGAEEGDETEAEGRDQNYTKAAASLGITNEAARTAVYRLRGQYRRALQKRVAREIGTNDIAAIREELLCLMEAC